VRIVDESIAAKHREPAQHIAAVAPVSNAKRVCRDKGMEAVFRQTLFNLEMRL